MGESEGQHPYFHEQLIIRGIAEKTSTQVFTRVDREPNSIKLLVLRQINKKQTIKTYLNCSFHPLKK